MTVVLTLNNLHTNVTALLGNEVSRFEQPGLNIKRSVKYPWRSRHPALNVSPCHLCGNSTVTHVSLNILLDHVS